MEVRIKRSNRENPAFDELYHWKYIKKERVNGKWRYYYDADQLKDDLGINARDEMNKAITAQKTAQDALSKSHRAINRAVEDHRSYDRNKKTNYSVSRDRQLRSVVDRTFTSYYKNLDSLNNAKSKVQDAVKRYESTPLGKLEKTYKKVKRKIENLFD